MAISLDYIDSLADGLSRRARLERTVRIVSGGNCPHALARATVKEVSHIYCDKPVDPLTGEHADAVGHHRGDAGARAVRWREDDHGAFIE